jgi:hypothetical protein
LQGFGDTGDYTMDIIGIVYPRTYRRVNHHSLYKEMGCLWRRIDMNEIVRWIMTPLEVLSFVFFLTMLMVGGFVVLPYYFIRYGIYERV